MKRFDLRPLKNNAKGGSFKTKADKIVYDIKNQYIILNITLELKKNPVLNINYGDVKAILESQNIKNPAIKEVSNAIIDMILASLADEFLGYVSSTFSHYIQYMRFREDKSYYNYCNLVHNNSSLCRLRQIKESNCEWLRLLCRFFCCLW